MRSKQRVYPVNDRSLPPPTTKRLSTGDNFWISMPVAQTESYEPVGVAGTATEGNKEAYLKRFGVNHGLIGYISEPPAPDNPLPQPGLGPASTNYRSGKSVKLTRLDLHGGGVNGQDDDESDIYDPKVLRLV